MFGIIGYKPRYSLRAVEDIDIGNGGGGGGGGSIITSVIPGSNIAAPPTFNYDLSQIGQAIARGNKQSDVESAYQTFLTGIATGRGGQYAVDAQRKYGYASIRDAAAAYLDAAGLPRLASVVGGGNGNGNGGGGNGNGNGGGGNNTTDNTALDALRKQLEDAQKTFTDSQKTLTDSFNKQLTDLRKLFEDTRTDDGSPLEQLVDVLPGLFGQSVYNPPLQSQTYGYTPQSVTDTSGSSSGGFGMILILVVVAIVGYILYKKFAS